MARVIFFFFQAEDGIRDDLVTGVQTCALPILVLAWAIWNKKKVLGIALIALGASLAVVPKLGTEFLPELNEGSIWINVNLPTSVSVTETQRMAGRFRSALASVPEVESVISKCGRPEDGTYPKPINKSAILVTLKPGSQ